jgi:two-component sensor histidine kinase
VREARRFAATALREELGAQSEEMMLVADELATNAVCHARGNYELTVTLDDDRVILAVADSNPELPRPRTPDALGGRGLMIVDALATDWGIEPIEGDGKVVWAQVSVPTG